jgi:urease accessory protein
MNMKHTLQRIIFGALLCISTAALAHPGHDVSGFSAGLLHPFTGMDHLLAMFAVGLWAAQIGGRKIWLLPATFMSMLVAGAGLALAHLNLPLFEPGIAASVLALGLLIALSLKLPTLLSVAITAMFGLLHGYAHGLEMPDSAAPLHYALGFLCATAALHLGGVGMGVASRARCTQALGLALAVSGAYLLV